MRIHFLTLFPEVFHSALDYSLLKKAYEKGIFSWNVVPLRSFAQGRHQKVDDTPYGGGEGMIFKADVLYSAWRSVSSESLCQKRITILLSPQGIPFSQKMACELSEYSELIFVCGHYEGVDERFIDLCVDREVSIGDYILTGGELPALVLADTVVRLLPGVVGNPSSLEQESLEKNLLKYPQYTKPLLFEGLKVPDILLSGHHKEILSWREEQRLERTQKKRPDLFNQFLKNQS